ncbi:MAG: ferrous iron transporter B [Candidatus Latescibacteria bacterium]|nr:ferrous iron transporter B [Candidatus Latescibacterota bacterium]
MSERMSNYACHPIYGIPILLSVMAVLYLFVGVFGAEFLADFLQFGVIGRYVVPVAEHLLSYIPLAFVQEVFLGPYGLISMGLTAGIGIVFPIICTFFFSYSILEDSGYLSRVGILLNAAFNKLGLNGKAVLPLFLGFSCVTMASLSARALDTRKERITAILLLWLCIPCSAQLSIFAAILASISFKAVLVIVGVIILQMGVVGYAAKKLIPGEQSSLFLEVHPIRLPNIGYTISKTVVKVKSFIKEVIPLFLAASLALFALDKLGILYYIDAIGKPIVNGLLDLPSRMTEVFMLGIIRREAGAAFFKAIADSEALSEIQIIVAMVVMTLFIPCLTSVLVVVKEYGAKIAGGIGVFVIAYALFVGVVLNQVLRVAY